MLDEGGSVVIDGLALLFLVLILTCAIAALSVKDLLAAVVLFGAFSFFSAIFFAVMGALDVAFTEAAVGAVVTTVFFVSAIYRTSRRVQ
jgi:uncharacterized MnhB-related membrane protein